VTKLDPVVEVQGQVVGVVDVQAAARVVVADAAGEAR